MATSTAFAMLALALGARSLDAQAPGFKRVELQRHDIGATGREAVMVRAEFQPGAVTPRHTHPGEEVAYVLQGELTIELEGKPAAKLKTGDSFFVPASTAHMGKNTAKGETIVISTYIVEKGKPLATTVK
ncbi:MAG TPA: cupin domain-containing protein [Kofleriaceae bacterium]|nr:cupin domain-containing protein [Kofleriaceae bacterium]